jgi:hypothetical protein
MATNIYGFPKQKISNKKKDEEFHILCAEALIREASFNASDKAHLKSLYDAANNELDDKMYKYVTNPYNSEMFKKIILYSLQLSLFLWERNLNVLRTIKL